MMKCVTFAAAIIVAAPCFADRVIVQSTTSTQNSGLYDTILPIFENKHDIDVQVVAVGTGQALTNAQRCDGDLLITHAPEAENAFVTAGFGVERFDLMYNDFVLIGPTDDPANLSETSSVHMAFRQIAATNSIFLSRGDDSGTHKKEQTLWHDNRPDPAQGSWYRQTGSGMGATINTAIAMGGYSLTDRATWVSFGNKAKHAILVEGDPDLFNPYSVIVVDPTHCPTTNISDATIFANWLLSNEGQAAIASHQINGQQLFVPNAVN